MVDPNADHNEDYKHNLSTDSIYTYRCMKKIVQEFAEARNDIDKVQLKSWIETAKLEIPQFLLTDFFMSRFFQFDHKSNVDTCKYFYRKRRLRGYFSYALKFHNLPGFKTFSEQKNQQLNYPDTQRTMNKIERDPKVIRSKIRQEKSFLTLEEDQKLRKMPCNLKNPEEVQIKLGILLNATGAVRPKTYSRADSNLTKIESKVVNGFNRPVAQICAVGVKNDQQGKCLDSKGAISLPCSCPSCTDHDKNNTSCIVGLLEVHLRNIEETETNAKKELKKLKSIYQKQINKPKPPKDAVKNKKRIDNIEDFLSERTLSPLFLRPKFHKKTRKCIGFHYSAGPGQVQQMKQTVRKIIGRQAWAFGDGRRAGENHVLQLRDKFAMNVSKEEVAAQFGRHSVKTMEKNYLRKQKSTKAIDAYNLIRETYDLTGFNPNDEVDPFQHQRQVIQKLKNTKSIKEKRPSLEILSQVFPKEMATRSTLVMKSMSDSPPSYSPSIEEDILLSNKSVHNKENVDIKESLSNSNKNNDMQRNYSSQLSLSQRKETNIQNTNLSQFCLTQNQSLNQVSKEQNEKFTLMGMLFKHHLKCQDEENEAFERFQRRKQETTARFQEMMLKHFNS